jgi:hypothetical protein
MGYSGGPSPSKRVLVRPLVCSPELVQGLALDTLGSFFTINTEALPLSGDGLRAGQ